MRKNISKSQATARKAVAKTSGKVAGKATGKNAEKMSVKTEPKGVDVFVFLARIPVLVFGLVATVVFLTSLNRLNLLRFWQLALVGGVLATILFFAIYKLFISKKARNAVKIASMILVLILSVGCLVGNHYTSSVIKFVEKITGEQYETETYSVYVMKRSSYNELKQLNRQTVGYMSLNPHREETEARLQDAVSHKTSDFDNLGEMVTGLYDSKVAAVVLNESYIDVLDDTDFDFVEKTKVLYTFEVRSDEPDKAQKVEITKEPFVLYLSGTDSRLGLNSVARSDVNMLVVVNPKEYKMLMVSIPRDYYVQLHGTTGTKDKLTHAGVYGIDMSKNTIADLFGIDINYTAKVSFTTVTTVVDVLGGIEVNSDQAVPVLHTNKSCGVGVGKQTLNSECALAYARERYSYADGDRHRVRNQQDVLEAIINKLSEPHYLVKLPELMEKASDSFTTTLSYDEITSFAQDQLNSMKGWTIEKISVDGSGAMLPTYSMGSQPLYVMIPNQETVDAAKAKIAEYLK